MKTTKWTKVGPIVSETLENFLTRCNEIAPDFAVLDGLRHGIKVLNEGPILARRDFDFLVETEKGHVLLLQTTDPKEVFAFFA